VTKETINNDISEAVSSLVEMANNSCWNNISKNHLFILSEINQDGKNFFLQRIERKKLNDKKTPVPLNEIINDLKIIYYDLHLIELYIYLAKKKVTIIEIQYILKSNFEDDFYEKIKDNEPMLHCKIGIPIYHQDKSNKYDINWELGGFRDNWKMFWYRLKRKRQLKKQTRG
jgi:hypothetical protein